MNKPLLRRLRKTHRFTQEHHQDSSLSSKRGYSLYYFPACRRPEGCGRTEGQEVEGIQGKSKAAGVGKRKERSNQGSGADRETRARVRRQTSESHTLPCHSPTRRRRLRPNTSAWRTYSNLLTLRRRRVGLCPAASRILPRSLRTCAIGIPLAHVQLWHPSASSRAPVYLYHRPGCKYRTPRRYK